MQEFIRFLNQGWVGTFVGTAGAALAVFLYWRSRIPGIIAFQSQDVSMVGDGDAVFPAEVTFQYQGTPVPRITSSTVWMWNAGKKTVRGSDIVAHDPLRLRFSAEVLTVSIRKVSREALRIAADTSEDRKIVRCGFEFLDPGDGGYWKCSIPVPMKRRNALGPLLAFQKGISIGDALGALPLLPGRREEPVVLCSQ